MWIFWDSKTWTSSWCSVHLILWMFLMQLIKTLWRAANRQCFILKAVIKTNSRQKETALEPEHFDHKPRNKYVCVHFYTRAQAVLKRDMMDKGTESCWSIRPINVIRIQLNNILGQLLNSSVPGEAVVTILWHQDKRLHLHSVMYYTIFR